MQFLIQLFSIADSTSTFDRLIAAGISGAFWLSVQSIIAMGFANYHDERERLQDEFLQIERVELARTRLRHADEVILEQRIEHMISQSSIGAQQILNEAISKNVDTNLPDVARALAADHLRLLAHNISELSENSQPLGLRSVLRKFNVNRLLEMVRLGVRHKPLNPALFTLTLLFATSLRMIRTSNWPHNFYFLLIIGASTYLIQVLAVRIEKYFPSNPIGRTILLTCLNATLPILLMDFLLDDLLRFQAQLAFAILVFAITVGGFVLQAGLLHQEKLMQGEMIKLLEYGLLSQQINLSLIRTTRKWAQYIHGDLQSKLHAYALVLEQAQERSDTEEIENALNGIRRVIEEMGRLVEQMSSATLKEEVLRRCSPWEGILTVECDFEDDAGSIHSANLREIGECINEGISNAVRHGLASSIEIKVSRVRDSIDITLMNNGSEPIGTKYGLGSKTYHLATGNNWSLSRDLSSQRTVLNLCFSIDHATNSR